jgi:uncharacterized membrane protein YqjE
VKGKQPERNQGEKTMAQGTKESVALAARESTEQDLPSLVEQLAENVTKLLDQKLALLRVELKEEISAYATGAIVIAAGAIVAAVGFALANIALAFVVSTLFSGLDWSQPAKYALGFIITGLGYLVIGGIVIVTTKNRLGKLGLVPRRTMNELEKDKDWLQHEL